MKSKKKADPKELPRRYAAALRELKREIGRREVVQKALELSERDNREGMEKSRRAQEQLRRLSHEILSAQEEERKRISRELHDEVGQALTAINVKLAALKKRASVDIAGLKKHIDNTQRLVERSMDTVHRFARELRPPVLDDLGLLPALRACMKDFSKRTRIPIDVTALAAVERLGADKRMVLYRVAQEALANVAKHARATLVEVNLIKLDGDVFMEIQDNGKSFQVERVLSAKTFARLGLLGMRERVEMVGGRFTVLSSPEKGTMIRAQVPIRDGRRLSTRALAGAAQ